MYGIPGLGFAKPNEKLPPRSRDRMPGHETTAGSDNPTRAQSGEISDASHQDVKMGLDKAEAEGDLTESQDQPPQAEENNIPKHIELDSIMTETPALMPVESAPVGSAPVGPAPHAETLTPAPESLIESVAAPPKISHVTAALDAALQDLFGSMQQQEQSPPQTQPEIQIEPAPQPQDVAQGQIPARPEAEPGTEDVEWEVDSDPLSSSDSSSDASDSDSEAGGDKVLMGIEETAKLLMEIDEDSDAEGDKRKGARVRTKNEVDDEVILKPDVDMQPDTKIVDLGTIKYIIDSTVVVEAFTSGEYQVLDSGSVVCTPERVVVGVVADLLGQVRQPTYTVRFTNGDEIKALGLQIQSKLCYIPDHSTYIFTEPLKNLKGSDASNLHDEEVGEDEAEFSDDEKEREYKRQLKNKKREGKHGDGTTANNRRQRGPKDSGGGGQGPHPLSQEVKQDANTLPYDEEDDDGPYRPLARPADYGISSFAEPPHQAPRSGPAGGRGGRGNSRGGRGGLNSHGPQRGNKRGGGGRENSRNGGHNNQDAWRDNRQGGATFDNNQHHQSQPNLPQNQPQFKHYHHHQQQQQFHPAALGSQPSAPVSQFNFPIPGWPHGAPQTPDPPTAETFGTFVPQFPAAATQSLQLGANGPYVNPAFFASLLAQMQQQQGRQGPGP